MSIIDLQETSPDVWKAKYRGNYGVYTIKVKYKDGEAVDFACSCPSDYYPCKHIPMVEEAITRRVMADAKDGGKGDINLERLLKGLTPKELRDFIVRQAKNDALYRDNILLEFAHKADKNGTNKSETYTQILQKALDAFCIDDDYDDDYMGHRYGYDYDDCVEIDVLDKWLDKARKHVEHDDFSRAVSICKACIEEYASWYCKQESFLADRVSTNYQEKPFSILLEVLSKEETYCKDLLDYCKTEMMKQKYKNTYMYDGFNRLLMRLSIMAGTDDFIVLQDKLLHQIEDKCSYDAKNIMKGKIKFYRENKQLDKAWDVIRENLSIESFRQEWVEKLIADGELPEAKKLVDEFIAGNADKHNRLWYELKLQIAQKENDIQEIQRVSFHFIESRFDSQYYNLYKSTFSEEEWAEKAEALIQHYEQRGGGKRFSDSAANVLRAEKQTERLMEYVIKHLSPQNLVEYHTAFSGAFPKKTLDLFRHVVNIYAKNNLGREHYKNVVDYFKMMMKINGGNEIVEEMISQYRAIYKNRKAMMEIINKFMPAIKASGYDAKKESADCDDCPEPLLLEL